MAEEIAAENEFPTFNGCDLDLELGHTAYCITYRPLPTCQISFKSNKRFVDVRSTYVRTFEAHFLGRLSRPKNGAFNQIAPLGL